MYTTVSRTRILEFLEINSNRTVTVSDIMEYLKESDCEVNVTTVYRFLDRLAKDGKVIKYVAEKGSMAVYQYVAGHKCEQHLHLKCTHCGSIIHMECEFMDEIAEHVMEHHGFAIQCRNSIVYGCCKSCRGKMKKSVLKEKVLDI